LKKSANPLTEERQPVLGQAAGLYRERPVIAALRLHFACAWFHTARADSPGTSAIVPDGCADLIWFNHRLYLAGPDLQVKIETVPPGMSVVGLRFMPGAAAVWLKTSTAEIVGARLPLEDFWGSEARLLATWIGETTSPHERLVRLESALAPRITERSDADDVAAAMFRMVADRRDESIPVLPALSQGLGLSERTVRRRFQDAFGYGPKTLDRILRFQRFLALARDAAASGTADLGAEELPERPDTRRTDDHVHAGRLARPGLPRHLTAARRYRNAAVERAGNLRARLRRMSTMCAALGRGQARRRQRERQGKSNRSGHCLCPFSRGHARASAALSSRQRNSWGFDPNTSRGRALHRSLEGKHHVQVDRPVRCFGSGAALRR